MEPDVIDLILSTRYLRMVVPMALVMPKNVCIVTRLLMTECHQSSEQARAIDNSSDRVIKTFGGVYLVAPVLSAGIFLKQVIVKFHTSDDWSQIMTRTNRRI